MANGESVTEFRRRHGKKLIYGGGSAGVTALAIWLAPQIEKISNTLGDTKALTERVNAYEYRANMIDAEQAVLRSDITSLKSSRDYQQGLIDGMARGQPQVITNYVRVPVSVPPPPVGAPITISNLWNNLTNRSLRMTQLRTPDGEINVWFNDLKKGK